jgi:D-beta-D-heptose 7-phosphate kinase/D-beta-D-heptose 1-phosphate adenosyltransferase
MKIQKKIKTLDELKIISEEIQKNDKTLVFTNGVFDILHRGHVEYLENAATLGDILIVGLNSDNSVRKIRGEPRPLVPQEDRAAILAALESVDFVTIFEDETPNRLLNILKPNVLVKGGDYTIEGVVGRELVTTYGGKVLTATHTPNRSTTDVIEKIVSLTKKGLLS